MQSLGLVLTDRSLPMRERWAACVSDCRYGIRVYVINVGKSLVFISFAPRRFSTCLLRATRLPCFRGFSLIKAGRHIDQGLAAIFFGGRTFPWLGVNRAKVERAAWVVAPICSASPVGRTASLAW